MPSETELTGAPWTVEPGAIVFLPEPTEGFTDDEIAALFTGTLTAAGEPHAGAMIALVPATEDMRELELEGGEPLDKLHTTVFFLGAADEIDDDARLAILTVVEDLAQRQPVVLGDVFGFSVWNPTGPERCVVADVNGEDLADCYDSVAAALDDIEFAYPDQHEPYRPHITLMYDVTEIPDELLTKTGPITYDRLRVAFGGVVTDVPLGGKIA